MINFIGRHDELELLRRQWHEVLAGQGRLAMLVGEPGIGKTTLARAFAAERQQEGTLILWGGCFEGDWQPPYAPWVEALRDYVRGVEPAQLSRQLGPGVSPLARLLPIIQTFLPDTPLAAPLSPNEERFRLYEAVTQWLLAISQGQPLLIVLDDLHWADRESLLLLQYLARFVARGRLLVVGTYRDLEMNQSLSDLLAVLRRETDYVRILVRGLSYSEVAEVLAQAAEQKLPQALLSAIYSETGGNPFYVRELFCHLAEEHKIVRREGRWFTDFSIGDLGIPEGVRQVVERRVSRLSGETRAMAQSASAFTGGFTFQVLQALTELPEVTLLNCLDEALQAGLLQTTKGMPVTYDFMHALVRHALYERMNPDRRVRLHRRIAVALERIHPDRELSVASELAVQYYASAALPGAVRGVRYALAAAEQAHATYAHERAVSFLRMARDLAAEGEPARQAEILCRLAITEAKALMLAEARQTAEAALALLTEEDQTALFLAEVGRALKEAGAVRPAWEPLVERGLALVGERRDLLWARLTLLLDRTEVVAQGPIKVAHWLGFDPQAVAIARQSGDEDDYARTLEPYDWRSRQETEAVLKLARTWRRPMAIIRALDVVARDLIYRHGDVREAAERLQELLVLSERYGSVQGQVEALGQLSLCQAFLGDLTLAQQTLRRAQDRVEPIGAVHRLHLVVNLAMPSILNYLLLDGDWSGLALEATNLVSSQEAARGPLAMTFTSFAILNYSLEKDIESVQRLLTTITPVFEQARPTEYILNGAIWMSSAGVWESGLTEFAERYRRLAMKLVAAGVPAGPIYAFEPALGRMAALQGDITAAQQWFAQARVAYEASGHRPFRALVDYDEGLALIRAGSTPHERLTPLLEAALTQFQLLGMTGWQKRAVACLAQLKPPQEAGSLPRRLYPAGMTVREVEVLGLIAAGYTNREIADTLIISVPTVERHIANIYNKIGARNRADATAYALTQGLSKAS